MKEYQQEKLEPKKLSVKEWAEEDQPREKLIKKGASALSDTELLAILLRTGSQKYNVIELARRILDFKERNLDELGKVSLSEFRKAFKGDGLGDTKAVTLMAALELGRRRQSSEVLLKPILNQPEYVYNLVGPRMADLETEEVYALYMNNSNRLIEMKEISSGGITSSLIDIRIVLHNAIELKATRIILVHNHPSGQTKPSDSDIKVTRQLRDACDILQLTLVDHIIIGGKEYYSLKVNNYF